MAQRRKKLMVGPEQPAAPATRQGTSESATVREVVDAMRFVEEFAASMEALRATGYGAPERAGGDALSATGAAETGAPPSQAS